MVRQCIDEQSLTFVRLNPNNKVKNFDCGDKDLNDFIVQKMVKTLHFQCSDFQFLKMFG